MRKRDSVSEKKVLKTSSLWDHHGHLSLLGAKFEKVNLSKIFSPEKLYEILKKEASRSKKGDWIFGCGLNISLWKNRNCDLETLDKITPDNPIFLERIDAHSAVVNTFALKLAGLNPKNKEEGGFFEKEKGKLTGGIVDSLVEKVSRAFSEPDLELIEKRLKRAILELKRNFLSGATDMMISEDESKVLQKMDLENKLEIPILGYLKWSKDCNLPSFLYKGKKYCEEGIKVFLDGALGSRGAALKSPYSDDPNNCGVLLLDKKEIYELLKECNKKNVNVAFHIIGDRALDNFIEAVEKFADLKIKIRAEHLQITPIPLLERLRKTDVIFSLQPCHYLSDKKWAEQRIGKERMSCSYLLRSVISQRKNFLFGTDFPIEPIDPRRTLKGCFERKKEERIPISKILYGMKAPKQFFKYSKPCLISFELKSNNSEKHLSEVGIKYINDAK